MAVKTIEMEKIKFKELAAAIKKLNDSGLLKESINSVGSSKEVLVKSFLAAVQSIPDDEKTGEWKGPDSVAEYYQKITLAEDPIPPARPQKETKKKDKAPASTKAAGKSGKKEDKGPSTKFLVWQAWNKKKDISIDKLYEVGKSVKQSTVKTWVGWWNKGINLPAGAVKK